MPPLLYSPCDLLPLPLLELAVATMAEGCYITIAASGIAWLTLQLTAACSLSMLKRGWWCSWPTVACEANSPLVLLCATVWLLLVKAYL